MFFWHDGWVETFLSLSFHSSCVCLSAPSPSDPSDPCLHRCSVSRGREREYKPLRCEQGNCLLGRFYSLKCAHTPPYPVLYTHPPPSLLVYPEGFVPAPGNFFFPSTSPCVSCFVLVLFSQIPEFIEGFVGLSKASLLILKSLFASTFAASLLADGGGGFLLSLRGLRACVRKSVCVRRGERERERGSRKKTGARRSIFVHVTVGKGWLCGSELSRLSQDVLT